MSNTANSELVLSIGGVFVYVSPATYTPSQFSDTLPDRR